MKKIYADLIQWCTENPILSYWISIFGTSFIVLFIIYILFSNARLHLHIRRLNQDKERLMQEKDLMRLGKEIQAKASDS